MYCSSRWQQEYTHLLCHRGRSCPGNPSQEAPEIPSDQSLFAKSRLGQSSCRYLLLSWSRYGNAVRSIPYNGESKRNISLNRQAASISRTTASKYLEQYEDYTARGAFCGGSVIGYKFPVYAAVVRHCGAWFSEPRLKLKSETAGSRFNQQVGCNGSRRAGEKSIQTTSILKTILRRRRCPILSASDKIHLLSRLRQVPPPYNKGYPGEVESVFGRAWHQGYLLIDGVAWSFWRCK